MKYILLTVFQIACIIVIAMAGHVWLLAIIAALLTILAELNHYVLSKERHEQEEPFSTE